MEVKPLPSRLKSGPTVVPADSCSSRRASNSSVGDTQTNPTSPCFSNHLPCKIHVLSWCFHANQNFTPCHKTIPATIFCHCHRSTWGQIARFWIEDPFLTGWVHERCGQTRTNMEILTAPNHSSAIRCGFARAACTSSREWSSTGRLSGDAPAQHKHGLLPKVQLPRAQECFHTVYGACWDLLNWETAFQSWRCAEPKGL